MFGGNNSNPLVPISFGENHILDDVNALPQLQLLGDYPVGCFGVSTNHTSNQQTAIFGQPAKRVNETESISGQKKHQLSSSNNFSQYDACKSGIILNPNHVSIGLKLSCEEDEHNSSVTCTSESNTATLPVTLSLGDDLKAEINLQKGDLDHYIRLQEENFIKGVRELGQRHTVSLLSSIEQGISSKLHEKELQMQNINRKNKDLVERIKQVSMEVHSWHCRTKYNESVVNVLKSNLEQVMAQGAMHGKEGYGDSEVDTAASYANQNHMRLVDSSANSISLKKQMACRACKINEASILLFPCRHLCLCKVCEGLIDVCPICRIAKSSSVEVFLS
ncbi:BOI-related E3 ubiquitin-protein ligase 2 isoform X3 [Populus alba x Populus x berolinensis]|nr:BOI-related E3 ubiquitin-protein ligase 2 isoform X3 [Populus alba x Populus x berolinensis]